MTPENLPQNPPNHPPNFFRTITITAVIILLWVIVFITHLWQAGIWGAGVWGYVSYIALLATIIAPAAYGWYSRDSTGAIIIGALPFLLGVGVPGMISSSGQTDLFSAVAYFLPLSLAGGLEGYCAAKKTTGYLLFALLLAGIWTGIFLSGIH